MAANIPLLARDACFTSSRPPRYDTSMPDDDRAEQPILVTIQTTKSDPKGLWPAVSAVKTPVVKNEEAEQFWKKNGARL